MGNVVFRVCLRGERSFESWKQLMADFQSEVIAAALHETNGNTAETARLLGIGRTTLMAKMDALGVRWADGDIMIEVRDEQADEAKV